MLAPVYTQEGLLSAFFRILKGSFLYFPEIFKIFVNSFVNQKQLLNLERVGGDLRGVKFILGINPYPKRLSSVKFHTPIRTIIFSFDDTKSDKIGKGLKNKMEGKVAKTFSIKQETLFLLKKLQEVGNVNLSSFADKVLKKGAEEALDVYFGENMGEIK